MKTRAPIYFRDFEAPGYRRIRPFWWLWQIRDSHTGPILAQGHALTEWGAKRRIEQAVRRCVCVAGTCRCDRPVLRPLPPADARALTETLQADGVPVTVRVDGPEQVVLWPALALTPEQEAHTLHVVCDRTDAQVRWVGWA